MSRWYPLTRTRPLALALALALSLVGCGQKGDPAATSSSAAPKQESLPADLQSLVPGDAVALLYVKNPAELQEKVRTLVGSIEPEAAAGIDLKKMVEGQLAPLAKYWDMGKPMVIALSLPSEARRIGDLGGEALLQGVSFVIGVTDPEDDASSMLAGMFQKADPFPKKGDFLLMWLGEQAPVPGGSALAKVAPQGDIALRLDLATVVSRFETDIQQGLAEMGKMGGKLAGDVPVAGSALASAEGFLSDLVASAELAELGASIDGTVVDMAFGFTARKGSALDVQGHDHEGLEALAAHLPDGKPVYALFHMDSAWLIKLLGSTMEELKQDMPALDLKAVIENFGPNVALALGVPAEGLDVVGIADSKDPKALLATMETLLTADELASLGVAVEKTGPKKIGDAELTTYGVGPAGLPPDAQKQVDTTLRRLFAGDAILLHMAPVGERIVLSLAPGTTPAEEAVTSIQGGKGGVPPELQSVIDRAGGHPTFLLYADARGLVRQVAAVGRDVSGEQIPEPPAGDPIPVRAWFKHDGRIWGGGLSADVGGIAGLIESMDK